MSKYVPRQRKHRVRAREEQQKSQASPAPDLNALEILPQSKKEREDKRKQVDRLVAENGGQVSGKKRKRLEKYIDNKLRKEHNQTLVRKLEQSKVDTSLYRSTKNLGRSKDTKREALSRAARERRQGIDVEKNESLLFERPKAGAQSEDELEDESEDEAPTSMNGAVQEEPESVKVSEVPGISFGVGLKRQLELDEYGKPIIKKRKRGKGIPVSAHVQKPETEEVPWEGFSSGEEDGGVSLSEEDIEENEGSDSEAQLDEGDSESESEESEADESDASSPDEEEKVVKKARTSAFKAWADQARNAVVGFTPSLPTTAQGLSASQASKTVSFTPRPVESDPLPPELRTTNVERKAHAVNVVRIPAIQEARLALPVVAEEQKIMEAVHSNDIVVVCGATGSGKTTQVPQFLFESGYGAKDGPNPGLIGVTQPRRVAAVSMAKRVATELGDQGHRVAHQIRWEASVTDQTAIKFMTDGILIREAAQERSLKKYSVIVIDEAHERSTNTDVLIGLLSRLVAIRAEDARKDPTQRPLKLIIMSATLRVADFMENKALFKMQPPPLMEIEGRQFPVTTHFSRRTNRDYVDEAFQKVKRGHKKLPKGSMLVFLTGQNEIAALAKRLQQEFACTDSSNTSQANVRVAASSAPLETEDIDLGGEQDDYDDDDSEDEAEIRGVDNDEENEFDIGEEPDNSVKKMHILQLYSKLRIEDQMRVFEDPPAGSRAVILATNVAETSVTIPGIRYVFDCGRAKERKYDEETGVQSFPVGWISKASADQRAGRAGRTGPGHCYRLYSSAVYERDFEAHALPELLRTHIEGIVLQLKAMDIHHVLNFPFPTPPARMNLAKAEKLLTYLGALSSEGKIKELGRKLEKYPLHPRFSRILVIGLENNLTAHAISLVAALSTPEFFIPESQFNLPPETDAEDSHKIRTYEDNLADSERALVLKNYRRAHKMMSSLDSGADCMKLLSALGGYIFSASIKKPHAAAGFCETNFLRLKALQEADQLRAQLSTIIRNEHPGSLPSSDKQLQPPKPNEVGPLKHICAAGFVDQVAIRADFAPIPDSSLENMPKARRAIDMPYLPLFPTKDADSPFVYIHPSSLLASYNTKTLPKYIVYSRLQRSASAAIYVEKAPKTRMHPLTPLVRDEELAAIAVGTPLVRYSKQVAGVVELPKEKGIERREVTVGISLVPGGEGEGGAGMGWPLGQKRIVQRKIGGKGWIFEKVA